MATLILIKEVQPLQAAELQQLSTETFIDTYGAANTQENMKQYVQENFSISRIREELKDPHAKIFFAMLRDKPVAYLKLNMQKGILDTVDTNGLEIARIYVRKKYQGKKIGKLLFDTAVELAITYRHTYIWLGVWEKNPSAISFYEKLGFHRAGNHLFKLGEDLQRDIIMRYDL